jgi:hypothetical protein
MSIRSVLTALTAPSSPQPAYRRPLLPGLENRNAHGALASTPTGEVSAVRTAGIIADPTSYLAPLECGFPSTNLQLMAWLAVDGKWASQRVARRCGFRMDGIVRDGCSSGVSPRCLDLIVATVELSCDIGCLIQQLVALAVPDHERRRQPLIASADMPALMASTSSASLSHSSGQLANVWPFGMRSGHFV